MSNSNEKMTECDGINSVDGKPQWGRQKDGWPVNRVVPKILDEMEPVELKRLCLAMQDRITNLERENDDLKEICLEIDELRKKEELYRTVFNNTGTSILLIEEDMTISMANRQFFWKIGHNEEDVLGKMKWINLIPSEHVGPMIRQHRLRREDPASTCGTYEVSYLGKDGERRVALMNILMFPGTKKSIASLIDITEQKRIQKELEISEEKFRILAESCPFAIMMHQEDHWIYVNRAVREITGYSEDEFYAMRYWDFVHPDHKDMIRENGRKRQMGEDVPESYEFIIITKSNEERWVSLSGRDIDYGEKPTALISVLDITDQKEAEEGRRMLEKQLYQSQKLESIGRLAGGVAHDFNNMLGVILGHSELALLSYENGESPRANLIEIKKAAERSANLTRQLLAFARKQTVTLERLDLNRTVGGMVDMLRHLIGEEIHLDWRPAMDLWSIEMDPSQIDQIMANLCINSRDSIDGTGIIAIETGNVSLDEKYAAGHAGFLPGDYVKISVSDDGCGMEKDVQHHIFEPFFTTKEVGTGTGLGLSTVYGIVKQNKGFIHAYSEPGHGTTISIYFPRCQGKKEPVSGKNLEKKGPDGKETILVVEDEPAILEVTAMMLDMQGYTVLASGSPSEALLIAERYEGRIHMILTDVVMPEMNGRHLADRLIGLFPDIKQVFMSGYTANVIAHQGVLDQGVYFIQKPFTAKDLANKVRQVLDSE